MVYHKDASKTNLLLAERLPLQILLVENTVVNQKFALLVLKKIGYQADLVVNIAEMNIALTQQQYDIMLIDMRSLEKTGREINQYLCNLPTSIKLPYIIAMTTNSRKIDSSSNLEIYADDYISKPIQLEELIQALDSYRTKINARNVSSLLNLPDSLKQKLDYIESNDSDFDSLVIDIPTLQSLKNMLGEDQEAFTEVINCYLVESPKLLQLISASSVNQDAQTLWQTSHKFKSSSASIGAKTITKFCLELEVKGQMGNLAGSEELVSQLSQEYKRVEAALEKIIQLT